jgi:DNA invertase Pin-like site-specific DNA recombinase
MDGKYVSYLRVSTDRQGKSGLGLEAQREAVETYLNGGSWRLLREFVEVESGKDNDRPELAAALAHCRLVGATLIVAKLDRLSRNQAFLMSVIEGTGDAGVVFCDLPTIPAGPVGKFIVQQMAAVAELERGLISQRTTAALAAAKARGKALGGFRTRNSDGSQAHKVDGALGVAARRKAAADFAARVGPVVRDLHGDGMSLRQIAARLAEQHVCTARGGEWTATAVKNVLEATAA